MKNKRTIIIAAFCLLLFTGCSGGDQANDQAQTNQNESGLSDFEMENGIGPINEEITINEIDQEMAEKGEKIFKTKCSACHKMNERYVGPPLGNVLETRTPAFVMNMILNSDEMVKEHPVAKALLQEYMTPMPNQNVKQEEARAIVEYLASEDK